MKMVYCTGARKGATAVKGSKHKDLHYLIIEDDADIPEGYRAEVEQAAKPVKKKKTKKSA